MQFAQADSPRMDFIVTSATDAAGEVCPLWPWQPVTAHWGFPTRPRSQAPTKKSARRLPLTLRQIRTRVQLFFEPAAGDAWIGWRSRSRMKAIGREPLLSLTPRSQNRNLGHADLRGWTLRAVLAPEERWNAKTDTEICCPLPVPGARKLRSSIAS